VHEVIKHPIFTQGLKLPLDSIHGLDHWDRVERFGHIIANQNSADKDVVSLFAYLHDARRENEDIDQDHGRRAVDLLEKLIEENIIVVSSVQRNQLSVALLWHNLDGAQSEDVTILTCWDADRLDLWRVGIRPDPKRMFTDYGKSENMRNYSKQLYQGELNG